ncbi:hypothetical protein P12x_000307 [Tundrisphaera lichenicola]|uniref:hypothetical protein n=1 Tax=Tundrisphaera lichenicola TaxID=2029860 RepID=UPI003EBBAD3F
MIRHATAMAALAVTLLGAGAGEAPTTRREAQQALKPYGPLVGSWRGTGQPQRGRSQGAWQESAGWAWKLTDDSAALAIDFEKGKYLKSARLRPGPEAKSFVLEATMADDTSRSFSGKLEPGKPLTLLADEPGEGVRRITLTIPNENRFLLLLESRPSPRAYARIAEVGYTRNGVPFASGDSGPTCIVTEGRGTIAVTYQGKTYHVCCTGCRDLFNQDPAAVIAEAEARKKGK